MDRTQIYNFLRRLIFKVLGYMRNVVKGEINGSGVGLGWSYPQV